MTSNKKTINSDIITNTISGSTDRKFHIKILSFDNGYIIIVSENSNKLGAISISISTSNNSSTLKILPSKFDSIFINSIAERISKTHNVLCLISLYTTSPLKLEDMKIIMNEILNMLNE